MTVRFSLIVAVTRDRGWRDSHRGAAQCMSAKLETLLLRDADPGVAAAGRPLLWVKWASRPC